MGAQGAARSSTVPRGWRGLVSRVYGQCLDRLTLRFNGFHPTLTIAFAFLLCCVVQLVLPPANRGSPSPTQSTPIAPNHTGNNRGPFGVAPQLTGTTTLARQFTGISGSDPSLVRQLTGGGFSPTRQLTSSPTKIHDGTRPGVLRFPRPKSAIGYAARTKSEGGEGRGMFLVRQLTGGKNKEAP